MVIYAWLFQKPALTLQLQFTLNFRPSFGACLKCRVSPPASINHGQSPLQDINARRRVWPPRTNMPFTASCKSSAKSSRAFGNTSSSSEYVSFKAAKARNHESSGCPIKFRCIGSLQASTFPLGISWEHPLPRLGCQHISIIGVFFLPQIAFINQKYDWTDWTIRPNPFIFWDVCWHSQSHV